MTNATLRMDLERLSNHYNGDLILSGNLLDMEISNNPFSSGIIFSVENDKNTEMYLLTERYVGEFANNKNGWYVVIYTIITADISDNVLNINLERTVSIGTGSLKTALK